jgi:hypothetical protein
MVYGEEGGHRGGPLGKLIASVDSTLEDYIEAAAQAEHVALDEYAGALLQVGWDAVFGIHRSERLIRAAWASRQAELRAHSVKLRTDLARSAAKNGD